MNKSDGVTVQDLSGAIARARERRGNSDGEKRKRVKVDSW